MQTPAGLTRCPRVDEIDQLLEDALRDPRLLREIENDLMLAAFLAPYDRTDPGRERTGAHLTGADEAVNRSGNRNLCTFSPPLTSSELVAHLCHCPLCQEAGKLRLLLEGLQLADEGTNPVVNPVPVRQLSVLWMEPLEGRNLLTVHVLWEPLVWLWCEQLMLTETPLPSLPAVASPRSRRAGPVPTSHHQVLEDLLDGPCLQELARSAA